MAVTKILARHARLDLAIKALDVKLEQSEWFELYSASGQQVIR